MDFFTVPTVTFRLLYVLLIIQYDRRRILQVNVTAHPTAAWVCQQLREAFPFDTAVRYVLLDRDAIFSSEVGHVLEHMEVRPVRTSVQSPWQNGVAERWIGICRRELLDHVIVLNEVHLRRLLHEFVEYYHTDRTHLSLGKDSPTTRAVCVPSLPAAMVVALPRVDGSHHRYDWRDAAVSMEMEFWRGTGAAQRLIHTNKQRQKDNVILAREAQRLTQIEAALAIRSWVTSSLTVNPNASLNRQVIERRPRPVQRIARR